MGPIKDYFISTTLTVQDPSVSRYDAKGCPDGTRNIWQIRIRSIRTITNQVIPFTARRKSSEFAPCRVPLNAECMKRCFCPFPAASCSNCGQQQASARLLSFSPFLFTWNKSNGNNNPFCMHTSCRTKYSNESLTSPPFKCRTQCAARSEETPALAAVESTWHRSHIWHLLCRLGSNPGLRFLVCFFPDKWNTQQLVCANEICIIKNRNDAVRCECLTHLEMEHFTPALQPLVFAPFGRIYVLRISGWCERSAAICCNPSRSAAASLSEPGRIQTCKADVFHQTPGRRYTPELRDASDRFSGMLVFFVNRWYNGTESSYYGNKATFILDTTWYTCATQHNLSYQQPLLRKCRRETCNGCNVGTLILAAMLGWMKKFCQLNEYMNK